MRFSHRFAIPLRDRLLAAATLLVTVNAAFASGVTYTFNSADDGVVWPASIANDTGTGAGEAFLSNYTGAPLSINSNFQGVGTAPGFSAGNDALWGNPYDDSTGGNFGPGLEIDFGNAPNGSVSTASFDFAWIDQYDNNAPSTVTVNVADSSFNTTSTTVTLSSFTSPNGYNGGSTTGQAGTVSLSASSLGLSNIYALNIDFAPINSYFAQSEFGIDNLKLDGGAPAPVATPYTLADGADTISANLYSSNVDIGPYNTEAVGSTVTVGSGVSWTATGHFRLGYNDGTVGGYGTSETTDTLHLLTGSFVNVAKETYFGWGYNKRAVVTIDAGAGYTSGGDFQIGDASPGNPTNSQSLLTDHGSLTTLNGALVAVVKGGRATVNIDGPTAMWINNNYSTGPDNSSAGTMSVGGQGGDGTLNVLNGGTVRTTWLAVGDSTGFFYHTPGNGQLTVTGDASTSANSRVEVGDLLTIGQYGGTGRVDVQNLGVLNAQRVYVNFGDTGGGQGSLVVHSGGQVNISQSLTTWANGSVDVTSGGKVVIGQAALGTTVDAGTVLVGYNGTLAGTGTIQGNVVGAGGTISPGHSPGTLNITGDVTLSSDTVLLLQVAGTGAGQFDVLNVSGALDLNNATLNLVFLNGYVPTAGDLVNLTMFQATSGITGTLGGVDVSGLPTGLGASVNFDSLSSGTVTFSTHPAPEPASLAMMMMLGGALLLRRRRA